MQREKRMKKTMSKNCGTILKGVKYTEYQQEEKDGVEEILEVIMALEFSQMNDRYQSWSRKLIEHKQNKYQKVYRHAQTAENQRQQNLKKKPEGKKTPYLDFLSETMYTRRGWSAIFKVLKDR